MSQAAWAESSLENGMTHDNTATHAHTEQGVHPATADGRPEASVGLEQRQQVVTAVVGEVGGAQVRQQLVRVGEFGEELQKQNGAAVKAGRPTSLCRSASGRGGAKGLGALCKILK